MKTLLRKTCYLDHAKAQSRSNRSSLGFNFPYPHLDPMKDSLFYLFKTRKFNRKCCAKFFCLVLTSDAFVAKRWHIRTFKSIIFYSRRVQRASLFCKIEKRLKMRPIMGSANLPLFILLWDIHVWHLYTVPSCRAPLICSNPSFLSASFRNLRRMTGKTFCSQALTSSA